MRKPNETKKELSFDIKQLRLMITVWTVLTALLLAGIISEARALNSLSEVTDTYVELQATADSLMKASDYLTEEAQRYTVTGERRYLENYFTEAEETRRRERAVAVMRKSLPDSEALSGLKSAMNGSLSLMDREYHAMKLVLLAQGDEDVPEAVKQVSISPEELGLSPEDKMELARKMTHDEAYYEQKGKIRDSMNLCIEELKSATYQKQYSAEKEMRRNLHGMIILIVLMLLVDIIAIRAAVLSGVKYLKHNNSGFTLAELLIVVEIILILVTITIPILSKQLEKSREAYDIYTMRQAASLAVEKYYMGVDTEANAKAAGLLWDNTGGSQNAYGIYNPSSGTFLPQMSSNTKMKPYGRGTKTDGGTQFYLGEKNGAYASKEDYRDAVVMISIYPKPKNDRPHIVVYWKYVQGSKKRQYVGDKGLDNHPKYCIRIDVD